MMRRFVLAIWLVAMPVPAAALDDIEAKLSIALSAQGKVTGEVEITNHTGSNLCMLPDGWNEGIAYDTQNHVLGNPVELTLLWPDTLNVVWPDDTPHDFPADINSGGPLSAGDARRLAKVGYHFNLYDCDELMDGGHMTRAEPKYQREVETDVITREAPAPP